MREPQNPLKTKKARKQFTGSCGHTIKPDDEFVLIEPRPVFCCSSCAAKPSPLEMPQPDNQEA